MTLCIAWTRTLKTYQELLIATDSRLRSYGSWNCCPKILTFPRTDCAICFEGDTAFAYPMIVQLQTAVANYPKALNRSQDIHEFKGHILKILNDMLRYKSDYEPPELSFILGGFSWKQKKFALWQLYYDNHYKIFTYRPISFWKGINGHIRVSLSGDYTSDAKQRLISKLKEGGKFPNGNLDMEPFEVLCDMLRENDEGNYPRIGGAPQLIKVYEHMNRTPIAVKWEVDQKPILSLLGRPLLDYEKTSYPTIDTRTMRISRSELIGA